MADKQVGSRIPEDVAKRIDVISEEISAAVPEANVSTSTIIRYAIIDYVKRYDTKSEGNLLFDFEIPVNDLEKNQLEVILKALKDIELVLPTVKDNIKQLENKILNLELKELIAKRKLEGGEK